MVLTCAELIFHNSPTKNNKDLTEFLKRNIKSIIERGRIKFRFKIAKAADLDQLRERGIKKLPTMILDKRQYIGVPKIIECLHGRVKNSQKTAPRKPETELLDDYFKETLTSGVGKGPDGKFKIEENNDMDENIDLGAAALREMKRREGSGSVADPGQPPKAPDRTAIRDDDFEQQKPRQLRRPDNVGDPQAAFNNLTQRGGQDQDDELLGQLLSKMGGEDY